MIEQAVDILKTSRNNFIGLLGPFTDEQLNFIPPGFKNNLIWNFGHVIATQQLICYKLAGCKMRVEDSIIDRYRKGTAPTETISSEEIQRLKSLAIETCDWMLEDYKAGLLNANAFHEYTTSYNVTLKAVEDAIYFNNVHDGIHIGYAMAIRKVINA